MSESGLNTGARHIPVLPDEVIQFLSPRPCAVIVDATVGGGGHARLLAERIVPGGRLIGIDQDEDMLAVARNRLQGLPVVLIHANFDHLREVLDRLEVAVVDGVLADLGVSSDQIETAERGFSFQSAGPLDMRMDRTEQQTAGMLLRALGERELADLFWKYGEERFSRKIARRIVETRHRSSLATTADLADLVRRCISRPRHGRRSAIDPATRVFQALRIAVNDELGALDRLLKSLPDCIKPGGRAVIISFHSLEDRLVKQAFRDRTAWETLTRKPIRPSQLELKENPRARSAKLRAARRLETTGNHISGPLKGVGK